MKFIALKAVLCLTPVLTLLTTTQNKMPLSDIKVKVETQYTAGLSVSSLRL